MIFGDLMYLLFIDIIDSNQNKNFEKQLRFLSEIIAPLKVTWLSTEVKEYDYFLFIYDYFLFIYDRIPGFYLLNPTGWLHLKWIVS